MPKGNNQLKGSHSEQVAVNYLTKKGYKILSRNYFQKVGEIDIIATYKNIIVFVEVKSTNTKYISSVDLLNKKKLYRLYKTINIWLYNHKSLNSPFRLDFIGLEYDNYRLTSIKHFENVLSGSVAQW